MEGANVLQTVLDYFKAVLGMIKNFLAELGINFEKKDDEAADAE